MLPLTETATGTWTETLGFNLLLMSMNLVFLLPLVSPRTRARAPIGAVTEVNEANEACLLAGRLHEAVVEIDRGLGDVGIDARRALVQPGWADPIISALRPCLEAPRRASGRKPPELSIGVYGGSMTAGFMNCHSQARIRQEA